MRLVSCTGCVALELLLRMVQCPLYIVLLDTIGPNEVGTANKIPMGMVRSLRRLRTYDGDGHESY